MIIVFGLLWPAAYITTGLSGYRWIKNKVFQRIIAPEGEEKWAGGLKQQALF
jgi:hypothetical protein